MTPSDEQSISEAMQLVARAASLLRPTEARPDLHAHDSLRLAQAVAYTLLDQLRALLPPALT
jgi:hypothetical protein